MFGCNINDLALLERLNTRQEVFDPETPEHARLLNCGLMVHIAGDYYPMPTDSFYAAHEFREDVARLQSYAALPNVKGRVETPGVRVEFGTVQEPARIDGVDLASGDKVMLHIATQVPSIAKVCCSNCGQEHNFVAGQEPPAILECPSCPTKRGIVDEMEATHAPIPEDAGEVASSTQDEPVSGCRYDTDGDGNCHVHPEGCPEPSVEAAPEGHTEDPIDVPETNFGNTPEAPTVVEETPDHDSDGIPTFDDTRQWERVIGDLPQAYEALRPTIRLLVKAGLADHLYTKIYSAAFQAKEVGRHREFIKDFNRKLTAKLNEDANTVNTWFESWLHGLSKEVLSFDGSEEVDAAVRFIMKRVPDDRKDEIRDYLQTAYISTGIARFFPESVRRFKEANARVSIAKPVSWIIAVAEQQHEQAEKDQKRPPACDPALIDYALMLIPPTISERERKDIRERLEFRLNNFGGISMDEVLTAWETGFGDDKMPATRYSRLFNFLKKHGLEYLTTKEAILAAAKEIVFHLLTFVEQPQDEPIGSMTWMESNAAQLRWIKAVSDVIDEVEVDGLQVYLKAWNIFMDERWAENKVKLQAKEAW